MAGERPDFAFDWATDENFTSGPAVGNPTKVDPPAWPTNAQGFVPGQGIAAEHQNKVLAALGDWSNHLSDMQIQNWETSDCGDFASSRCMVYVEGLEGTGAWVIGRSFFAVVRISLITATNETATINPGAGSDAVTWLAAKPAYDLPSLPAGCFVGGSNNFNLAYVNVEGVYSNLTLTGVNSVSYCGAWDADSGRFILGGAHDTGGATYRNRLWYIDDLAAAPAETVGAGVSNAVSEIITIAADRSGNIIAFDAQANSEQHNSSDGGANWTFAASGFGPVACVTYNEEQSLWMCVTTAGEVRTSIDGAVWALVGAVDQCNRHTVASSGSYWVISPPNGAVGGQAATYYSTDAGVSWKLQTIPAEATQTPANAVITGLAYSRALGRFGACGFSYVSWSMAAGRSNRNYDGTTSAP